MELSKIKVILSSYATTLPNNSVVIDEYGAYSWANFYNLIANYSMQLTALQNKRGVFYLQQHSKCSVALLLASLYVNTEVILVSDHYSFSFAETLMKENSADYLILIKDNILNIIVNKNITTTPGQITEPTLRILTSGTTSTPKTISYTPEKLTLSIRTHKKHLGRRWFMGFSLLSFSGLQIVMQSMLNGGTLIIPKNSTTDAGKKALLDHAVDYISCTPTYMRNLLSTSSISNWSHNALKHITLGGEIVDQALLTKIMTYFATVKLTHIYGSTEFGELIVVKDKLEGFQADIIDNIHFKIIDDELFVRNKNQQQYPDWFGTRDQVKIVDKRAKFLGRIDDIINVGGYKVMPHVVESVIRQISHVVNVVIVPHKSAIVGNLLKAIVQIDNTLNPSQAETSIISICQKQLPYYMVPTLFQFVDKMPATISNKLIRNEALYE